jgi:hypothetical protein
MKRSKEVSKTGRFSRLGTKGFILLSVFVSLLFLGFSANTNASPWLICNPQTGVSWDWGAFSDPLAFTAGAPTAPAALELSIN